MTPQADGRPSRTETVRDGIFLVDKCAGETSFDVVRKVRRVSGLRKVGHAGTLDPFSTGLLVVMLGRATKLAPFLMEGSKTYRAVIRLGIETDTYDPEGHVVHEAPVPDMTPSFIQRALGEFEGEIQQVPPAHSAVHVDGVRAYKLARKGLEVRLRERSVVIHEIRLLSVDLPDITVEVSCSHGTYLRSLAHDLGKTLGTGACLVELRRTGSGPYHVEDAVNSADLEGGKGRLRLKERILPLDEALPDMRRVQIGGFLAGKIRNGYQPAQDDMGSAGEDMEAAGGPVQLLCDGELIAIVESSPQPTGGDQKTKVLRVFN